MEGWRVFTKFTAATTPTLYSNYSVEILQGQTNKGLQGVRMSNSYS